MRRCQKFHDRCHVGLCCLLAFYSLENSVFYYSPSEDADKDTADDGQKDGVKGEMDMEVREDGQQKGDDDWEIPYSDEEMEEPKSWMPPPQEIKRLYDLLAKGEVLELNWVALPRRAPTPPRTPSPERDGDESQEPQEEENQNRCVRGAGRFGKKNVSRYIFSY